jgi:membrane protease subunit (stomatin/prohibitin family)
MAQQQQMAAQQAPAPAPAPAAAAPGEADYMAELEKLAELKGKGVITEEDFEAKKKQILGI